MYLDFECSAV